MTCASALSTRDETAAAFREVVASVSDQLKGRAADIALIFFSPHHTEALPDLAAGLVSKGFSRHLLGTTGESIVGDGREIEHAPAVSLWALRADCEARIRPIRLEAATSDDRLAVETDKLDAAGSTLLVLCDPFSFAADAWLRTLNERGSPPRVVGGVASGGHHPGVNRLLLDEDIYVDGAVALGLDDLAVTTIVSQGCRPIGRPMIVTRAGDNRVLELGRRPALDVLHEIFSSLPARDQDLVQTGLHLGIVMNEYQEKFTQKDFLARNVVGSTPEGALVITDQVRVGRTVQFMVHDAASARADLRGLLEQHAAAKARGALLFTCNGRGRRMFDAPDHDAGAIREVMGPIPTAGFFAMGEIGPVGGHNFLHGFTASIALFA